MTTLRSSRHLREDGFTLAELLIVILIMGILFAIALPLYVKFERDTRIDAIKTDVKATMNNVERYLDLNPGAGAADIGNPANVRVVKTDSTNESITIAGDYLNYTVVGQNISLLGSTSSYKYDSATGKYTSTGEFVNH